MDLENWTLLNLQQSELVNFGSSPNWTQATNPAITQQACDAAINRAYLRVVSDLADLELYLYTVRFQSVAQTSDYNLASLFSAVTPTPAPKLQRLSRLFYNPAGQSWTQEFEPGVRMVSWTTFQRYTAAGYLRPFTYNIIPDYCSITPDRCTLSFFPGSADVGDNITMQYVPVPTAGTAVPLLVNETDMPLATPEEADDLIVLWSTSLLWPKLREMQARADFAKQYQVELMRVRDQLAQRSRGDTLRIRDEMEGLISSYPVGGALSLP